MPEGPEIHMAARFINQVNKHHKFGGRIVKSAVSTKNPEVEFTASLYNIKAESRGKELKVFLSDSKKKKNQTHILFRFGMSGSFKLSSAEELPKHAHLQFFTVGEKPEQVLSFVDYRRFGRWEIEGDWGKDRGPDPMFDYNSFRQNVLNNLQAAAFNKPICETLLDQKYFNGIGNYLRAEILFRAKVKPFSQAREVLEGLGETCDDKKDPDILLLCHIVPLEVLKLDKGKNYDPQESDQSFDSWLQCYYVDGMKNLKDGNGRTIWFAGDPGPMVPKNSRTVGRKGKTASKFPKSGRDIKEEDDDEKLVDVKDETQQIKKTASKFPLTGRDIKEEDDDKKLVNVKDETQQITDDDETNFKRPKRSRRAKGVTSEI